MTGPSGKPNKRSGAFNRKRKLLHAEEDKKAAKVFNRFVVKPTQASVDGTLQINPNSAPVAAPDNSSGQVAAEQDAAGPGVVTVNLTSGGHDSGAGNGDGEAGGYCDQSGGGGDAAGFVCDGEGTGGGEGSLGTVPVINDSADLKDPAKWSTNRATHYTDQIIMQGPVAIKDRKFFRDKDNRHFSISHCYRNLPNGEKILRRWLQYSDSADKIFCFCCKLFDKKSKAAIANSGFCDWRHIAEALESHEKSASHFNCYALWSEAELRVCSRRGIDDDHQRIMSAEVEHWRSVLERLISITLFLSENNLAFRGASDKFFEKNNGNFLQLVELLGKYDPIMKEHLRRVLCSEISDHYCSKTIQNELINMLGNAILSCNLDCLKKAKYFSVIVDCTPDISKKEQMSITLRYVEKSESGIIKPTEHFVGFVVAEKSDGAALATLIIDTLKKMGITVVDLRGQGYDNGANMKGKRKGVQARIQKEFPRAKYVPCGSHSLNLVLCDSAQSNRYCVTLFGVIQRIYVLFSSSPGRWSVLLAHISDLTLKDLCETRWESRIDAVKPFRYDLKGIQAALMAVNENPAFDSGVRHEAKCLAKQIIMYEFVVSIVVWYDILFQVNIVSKAMQAEAIDIQQASSLAESCIEYIENYAKGGFESALTTAKEITAFASSNAEVERRRVVRRPQRLIEGDDSSESESYSDSGKSDSEREVEVEPELARFKTNFFEKLMTVALKSVKKRFQFFKEHSETWGFLYDLKALPGSISDSDSKSELMVCCMNLQKQLSDENSQSDINGPDLCSELQHLSACLSAQAKSPREALQFIHKTNMLDIFPNVDVALRILLTLPVTVAAGERSFSKLKLIETYLRATMGQERLSNLALISIENDVARALDITELVKQFAQVKARKAPFL